MASNQEADSRYHVIFEHIADVIFRLHIEPHGYRFVSVNPAFTVATGIPREQVVGKLVNEIIPEPSLSVVLGKYEEAIRTKQTVRWQETSTYPSGERHGEVSVTPVFDADGEPEYLIGSVHDVTEHRQAEAALRRSEERMRAVTEALPDVVFVLDEDGRFVEILTADKGLLTRDASELKGRRMHEVLEPAVADAVLDVVLETLHTGRSQVLEYELDVARGRRHFEARTAALDLAFDGKRAAVFVTRDVTDRQLLKELEAKTRELEAFNEAMVGRESRIIELKEEVNGLARELGRTPPYPPVWKRDGDSSN